MSVHNPTRYVPIDYPEVIANREKGCSAKPFREPRIDYAREFFCNKWGQNFRCICPSKVGNPKETVYNPTSKFRGVGKEMQSLDYFSILPIRPEGSVPGIKEPPTMAEQMGLSFKNTCPKRKLELSSTCPVGYSFKPDTFQGDSICGSCEPGPPQSGSSPNTTPESDNFKQFNACNDYPECDMSPDLPFKVCFTQESSAASKIRIRTGAERCLQPSKFREIKSIYKEEFRDFMKIKTKRQISLYRTPLVIDNRRAHPKGPVADSSIVIDVNSGPLTLNAKPIQFKSCDRRAKRPPCLPEKPDFEVIIPGPIILPC